jgi:hypothetical protein
MTFTALPVMALFCWMVAEGNITIFWPVIIKSAGALMLLTLSGAGIAVLSAPMKRNVK